VTRLWLKGKELVKCDYASKIFYKQTLASKRIAIYESPNEPIMINLLDCVYKEIEI